MKFSKIFIPLGIACFLVSSSSYSAAELGVNSDNELILELPDSERFLTNSIENRISESVEYFYQTGEYIYPVIPGSEDWKSLTSHLQMEKATQIPNEIINQISSEKLLELTINHPLVGDLLVFDNINAGFTKFRDEFNGIRELLKRRDALDVALNRYYNNRLTNKSETDTYVPERSDFKNTVLEMILGEEEIFKYLENDIEFIETVSEKLRDKIDNPKDFQHFYVRSSDHLLTRALEAAEGTINSNVDNNARNRNNAPTISYDEYLMKLLELSERNINIRN